MRTLRLFPVLALLVTFSGHAQEVGTLTLLNDTPLHVIRGTTVLQGIEGMRIRLGDVLQTGPPGTAQAQLEFSGDVILELGPSTQVYLLGQNETVVLTGWLKGETASGNHRYSTSLASVTSKGGNILVHATDDVVDVFVEKGAASLASGTQAPMASSADKIFFTRHAGKPVVAAGRPSSEFVGAMPVCFRDVVPPRLSRFAGKKPPEPRMEHEVSYAEIEHLLRFPATWRKGLVERFAPRLRDQGFRQAIETHIAALPEWKPVLYAGNQSPTNNSVPQ